MNLPFIHRDPETRSITLRLTIGVTAMLTFAGAGLLRHAGLVRGLPFLSFSAGATLLYLVSLLFPESSTSERAARLRPPTPSNDVVPPEPSAPRGHE
jgi:hypothetical protein